VDSWRLTGGPWVRATADVTKRAIIYLIDDLESDRCRGTALVHESTGEGGKR